jgi:hypothetical protein
MKKTEKYKKNTDRWLTIGCQTRLEASTIGFRDSPAGPPLSLSVDALGYQGQRNGRQVWYFFVVFLWHSTPLSIWYNKVQILARWRRPVASHEALNPLYQLILVW